MKKSVFSRAIDFVNNEEDTKLKIVIIDPLPEELSLSEHEVYEMDKCAKMISKKFPKSS